MRCDLTKNLCDPESYYCHHIDRTFERSQNKTCAHLIPDEEAKA